MPKRYDPTAYLYASARIRALENRLTSKEQWSRMTELHSAQEVLAAYAEKGTKDDKRENAAEEALRAAFATVAESVPDPALILFLQYPYDCNNVKALEKCRLRGADPTDLLIDLGSIPTNTLQTVSENELLTLLPPHMAAALPAAREAFGKTGDPREIDFLLDKAAFADMQAAAAPFPFAAMIVETRAELTNLLICHRLIRMDIKEMGRSLLERAAIPCGRFDLQTLLQWYDGGEDALIGALSGTPYAKIPDKDATLSVIEKRADDHVSALVRQAKSVVFGAEVPIAYLMAIENESKNLRILLAAKNAGLDGAATRARMREHYV